MKLVQKRSRKTGLPPGTLVHIGEKKPAKVTITAFNYAGARCDERQDVSVDGLAPPTDQSITWVDVGGVHKIDVLELLPQRFQNIYFVNASDVHPGDGLIGRWCESIDDNLGVRRSERRHN